MKRVWIVRIFFLVLLLFSLLALLWGHSRGTPCDAAVYQDGKLLFTIRAGETKVQRVEDEMGNYNVIEAGPEGIRVTGSSCPDHLCEQSVWNGSGSMPIVCLPNRLVITAAEESGQQELDGVAY